MNSRFLLWVLAMLLVSVGLASGRNSQDDGKAKPLRANPEVIKLELLPRALETGESPKVLNKPYKKKGRLYFRLQMTNISIEPVEVFITDPYFQNRPELFRDGQLVEYRTGLSDLLESKEKEPSLRHSGYVHLEPGEFKVLGFIQLSDWYESLEPGHYQLSVKHRFEYGQQWVESNALTFEVVDK
jgi:hypothetical protein